MKICFFSYTHLGYGGGFEKYLIKTALAYSKIFPSDQIDIVTGDKELTIRLNKLLSFYYFRKSDKKLFNKLSNKSINESIKDTGVSYIKCKSRKEIVNVLSGYDLVYSKGELLEALLLRAFGIKNKLPNIIYCFGTPLVYGYTKSLQSKLHNFLYTSMFAKWVFGGASGFHVKNLMDKKILSEKLNMRNVHLIYNSIPEKYKQEGLSSIDFSGLKSKKIIFWVGRLTEQKGVEDLGKIVAAVRTEDIHWVIAGSGEEVRYINDLINRYDNVSYVGQVKQGQVYYLYANSDLFLNTSYWEGNPNVIVEALYFKLPVYAYDVSGVNDVLKSGQNGYLEKDYNGLINRLSIGVQNGDFSKGLKLGFLDPKMFDIGQNMRKLNTLFTKSL